jgi:hypothetical protein
VRADLGRGSSGMDDEQFAVTTALIALTRALLAAKAVDRDLLRKHLTSGRNLLIVGKQFEALDTYDYLMRILLELSPDQ